MTKHMVQYAFLFVHQVETAEDIVQDCWLHLWLKRDTLLLIPEKAKEAYVKQCIRNACIDHIRKNSKSPIRYVEDIELPSDLSQQINKDETLLLDAKLFVRFDLPGLIDILPRRERLVVEKKIQGYSNREIAEEMQISIGTVRCYWSRACHRLYSRIKLTTS